VAPLAPSGLTGTVTGTTVTLNWTAPAGGDAPTSYIVQAGTASGLNDIASFDTGTLDPGSSQAVSVSKPGNYAYHCNIHPFMKGTLVVR